MIRIIVILACIFTLCSCTDEQIARVKSTVDAADAQLARANDAVAKAEAALASAKTVGATLNSEQANRVIGQAEDALDQVHEAQRIVKTTADAAHSGLDAAIQAHAAGGSSIGVIGAAATGAIPGILAALAAGMKWFQAWRSFRQTVTGLDDARKALGESQWAEKVKPALDASQDESTKKHVVVARAAVAEPTSAGITP